MTPTRKAGAERFFAHGKILPYTLLDFWQWSVSDLISNLTRGRLAEYIVAKALAIPTDGIRAEWDPFDIITPTGLKIEVKSAAFLQSWKQKAPSAIRFAIPETRAWSSTEGPFAKECKRQADVYVFAIFAHRDLETLNPLDLDQWIFYVVPTVALNDRRHKSISLKTLNSLCPKPEKFHTLEVAVSHLASIRFP